MLAKTLLLAVNATAFLRSIPFYSHPIPILLYPIFNSHILLASPNYISFTYDIIMIDDTFLLFHWLTGWWFYPS